MDIKDIKSKIKNTTFRPSAAGDNVKLVHQSPTTSYQEDAGVFRHNAFYNLDINREVLNYIPSEAQTGDPNYSLTAKLVRAGFTLEEKTAVDLSKAIMYDAVLQSKVSYRNDVDNHKKSAFKNALFGKNPIPNFKQLREKHAEMFAQNVNEILAGKLDEQGENFVHDVVALGQGFIKLGSALNGSSKPTEHELSPALIVFKEAVRDVVRYHRDKNGWDISEDHIKRVGTRPTNRSDIPLRKEEKEAMAMALKEIIKSPKDEKSSDGVAVPKNGI